MNRSRRRRLTSGDARKAPRMFRALAWQSRPACGGVHRVRHRACTHGQPEAPRHQLRLIEALIEQAAVIGRILRHLGAPEAVLTQTPARASPWSTRHSRPAERRTGARRRPALAPRGELVRAPRMSSDSASSASQSCSVRAGPRSDGLIFPQRSKVGMRSARRVKRAGGALNFEAPAASLRAETKCSRLLSSSMAARAWFL